MWIYIWVFNFILWSTCLFLCQYSIMWFFYYCGSAVQLKIMGGDVSRNCFIVQESLVGLLFICLFSVSVVEYSSFKFYKELCWNFIRDCIDSVDGFWWPSLLCESYWSMSMGDSSIFWNLLQFSSSRTWSSCRIGLSLPWLQQDSLYHLQQLWMVLSPLFHLNPFITWI